MKQRVKVKDEPKKTTPGECQHYWVIEMANGPASEGRCKYCGAVKKFFNSIAAVNEVKNSGNPLHLPKMTHVKLDDDSKS